MTRSTGNVFRDLGFSTDEAESLRVRADLLLNLQKAMAARKLKQGEAAELLGVSQPRVSDLMRGRIDLFNSETSDRHAGQARSPHQARPSVLTPTLGRGMVRAAPSA